MLSYDFQPGCPLVEVIATAELMSRPMDQPNTAQIQAEHDAISMLSNAMLSGPDRMLELLADQALLLCRAHSAGISLEDVDESGQAVFRWRAIAGRLAPHLGGTMPRDFSPCGETVNRNQTLLMRKPIRHYPYVGRIGEPLAEALLAPFSVAGKPIGTVWVIAHDERVKFNRESARRLEMLSRFAGMAVTAIRRSQLTERTRARVREKA